MKFRLFLTAWLLFAAHFATNVVREHYPAFSLVEAGTLRVDRYQGFHPDIFQHADGHWYINSNVGASLIAAIPLAVFDPALDWLERRGKASVAQAGPEELSTEYRTKYPMRQQFFALVKKQGLHLRFGASAAVTSVFLMAPLSAAMVVLMYWLLLHRGVSSTPAAWLSLLFGLGTPVFFRTGILNHNLLLMDAVFASFVLLWPRPDAPLASVGRRLAAGALAGMAVVLDYSGVVPLAALGAYFLADCWRRSDSLRGAASAAFPFALGVVPPALLLMFTQWVMFGNPWLPAQAWMADAHYTDQGWRGFSLPALDLLLSNLFDPAYGLFTFGPLLALGFLPPFSPRAASSSPRILSRGERLWTWGFVALFLLFCSANQYARMQWNTGFRYLLPIVPFVFLAAADHLIRWPKWLSISLAAAAVAHSWVLAMVRDTATESWVRLFREGLQFPWLSVLRQTAPADHPVLSSPLLAWGVLAALALVIAAVWRTGYGAAQSREGLASHNSALPPSTSLSEARP